MTFPAIGTPVATSQAANATTITVNLPASIAAGDLIVVAVASDFAASTHSIPAPWVILKNESVQGVAWAFVAYLIAAGGETSVVVTHTTERSNALAWRVTGWHGTTPPEITAAATSAGSAAPDSASLTPSWGADDTLWMTFAARDDSAITTISAYPTNYTLGQGDNSTATSAGSIGGAARQLNAASEDPGAFTLSGSEQWNAYTLAVRPAAAGGAGAVLAGSWAGVGSWGATVALQANLAGSWAGAGSWGATLALQAVLVGAYAGAGTWGATLALNAALGGSYAGAGAWGADLTAPGAPGAALAGSWAGVGSWGGTVALNAKLAGSWAGTGSWGATIALNARLAGGYAGIAAWAADLTPGATVVAGVAGSPVEYVIELFNSGATFGPNAKLGELWDARAVGWSRYDRIPGKAFFTLPQSSPSLALLTPLTTHVAIWRISPTAVTQVYAGVFIDYDSTGDDVVCTCFDYLALLSLSRSGYRQMYQQKLVGTQIIAAEWSNAKFAGNSPLGFVTTGTLEDPLGTDGVTPIQTNNQFGLVDQMRLELFYDLSEIGRANTANEVAFHISRTAPYTFTFRKNAGTARSSGLVLGGNVDDYRHVPGWRGFRNDLATIGTTIGGGATEVVATDATGTLASKGRRQDVFTIKTLLGIVGKATEADQQKAAAERALKAAVGLQPALLLKLVPGVVEPFIGWDLNDTIPVEIGNGIDSIATSWRIAGTRATFDEAGEAPAIIVVPVAT